MNAKLLESIRRELSGERTPDVVPAGWFTIEQLAAAIPCGVETMRRRIKAKGLPFRIFRLSTGRRLYPVPHYRIK